MTEREYLLEQLALVRESYALAAKPYIDRLVQLAAMETRPIVLPADFKFPQNFEIRELAGFKVLVDAEVKQPANPHEA